MKYVTFLSKFFYINYEKQYPLSLLPPALFFRPGFQMTLIKPTLFSLYSSDTSESGSTNEPVHSTINTGKTNEKSPKSLSSTPVFLAWNLPRAEKHSLSQATHHKLQKSSFPNLRMIKESEGKTSLRSRVFLRSIKNWSWKLYLPRATIFPLRICSKTLKLNITYSLTVKSLNTKLLNYPRTSHKQMSNLVDWGSLNARHH